MRRIIARKLDALNKAMTLIASNDEVPMEERQLAAAAVETVIEVRHLIGALEVPCFHG